MKIGEIDADSEAEAVKERCDDEPCLTYIPGDAVSELIEVTSKALDEKGGV